MIETSYEYNGASNKNGYFYEKNSNNPFILSGY